MIGFMSVEAQVDVDFDRARRRAFYGRVAARLRRECSRLLAFDEVGEGHLAHNRRRLGLRDVKVSKIVGSVGRPGPSIAVMPTKSSLAERWKRGGPSVPPRARFASRQVIQDGGPRTSSRTATSRQRCPLPGRGDHRGRCD